MLNIKTLVSTLLATPYISKSEHAKTADKALPSY